MVKFLSIILLCRLAEVAASKDLGNNIPGSRLEGGEVAKQGELPYQIGLSTSSFQCGGAILSPNVVVTAAQCVYYSSASLRVTAGDLKRTDASGNEQNQYVSEVILHEDFDLFSSENNIALLILRGNFSFNENVQAITLPGQHEELDADLTGDVLLSGWGFDNTGGGLSDDLKKAVMPAISDNNCRIAYNYSAYELTDSMLCAGVLGNGVCSDVVERKSPGISTEVSYFVDWMNHQLALRNIYL